MDAVLLGVVHHGSVRVGTQMGAGVVAFRGGVHDLLPHRWRHRVGHDGQRRSCHGRPCSRNAIAGMVDM